MISAVLFFLLLGCFTSWIVIQGLLVSGFGQGGDAEPQHHHTHTGVIPRIGGVGIIAGFAIIYLLCFFLLDETDDKSLIHYAVFGGGFGAFLLGFIDDFHPLGAKVKLLAQIILAMAAHECGLSIEKLSLPFIGYVPDLGVLSMGLTVFWFVAMMNLINLIDGLDGLAGGVGLMLMVMLAYLGLENGVAFSSILAIGMAGAILGFLFHNFPPAKVYMGDSGAYLIGYVIAALSLINSEKGTVVAALVAPALALALPIADVAFAMLRRGLRGLPLFRPDRNHIHHRLIRAGLSHRGTVLVLYAISLCALIGGLLVFASQERYLGILLGFAFVVILLTLRGQKITASTVQLLLADSFQTRKDTRNALYLKDWFIAEAERADTAKNLWADYRFVLKKIGICRAEIKIGNEVRDFYVPNTAHEELDELWVETHTVRGAAEAELTLYGEKEFYSERQFTLICDIAAEAWANAGVKWKEINGCPLDFGAKSSNSENYREQKSKALYRPTY
ncbi:MAG: glycosyltransferase family 4 protein [Opitutaceae bacterium]